MSGDAIVLCSLITSLPAGLVPIMSANSQLSGALLPAALSSVGTSFTPQKILISTSISCWHSDLKSCFCCIENVCQQSYTAALQLNVVCMKYFLILYVVYWCKMSVTMGYLDCAINRTLIRTVMLAVFPYNKHGTGKCVALNLTVHWHSPSGC